MVKKNWHGVPLEKIQEWQKAFGEKADGCIVPGACPVCGQHSLRHYYYLNRTEPFEIRGIRFQGKGSVWEWCASCGAYEHAQAFVPEGWNGFIPDLDHYKLTPIPDAIDELIAM